MLDDFVGGSAVLRVLVGADVHIVPYGMPP
jgi:hypothetical protein